MLHGPAAFLEIALCGVVGAPLNNVRGAKRRGVTERSALRRAAVASELMETIG
jgi:hypothetical protein